MSVPRSNWSLNVTLTVYEVCVFLSVCVCVIGCNDIAMPAGFDDL